MTNRRMPPWFQDCGSSSDEDSSDDEDRQVDASRYAQLGLGAALQMSSTRLRALQELQAILEACYTNHASKAVQAHMLSDIHMSITTCDRRRQTNACLAELIKTAEKVLPQQKRQQVTSQYKKAMMALARRRGEAGSSPGGQLVSDSDSDSDEPALMLMDLPDTVTLIILSYLDPVSLARASTTCRCWSRLVFESGLWGYWCTQLYGQQAAASIRRSACHGTSPSSSAGQIGVAPTCFASLVQGDPSRVLLFKQPPRLFCSCGHMLWCAPCSPHTGPCSSQSSTTHLLWGLQPSGLACTSSPSHAPDTAQAGRKHNKRGRASGGGARTADASHSSSISELAPWPGPPQSAASSSTIWLTVPSTEQVITWVMAGSLSRAHRPAGVTLAAYLAHHSQQHTPLHLHEAVMQACAAALSNAPSTAPADPPGIVVQPGRGSTDSDEDGRASDGAGMSAHRNTMSRLKLWNIKAPP